MWEQFRIHVCSQIVGFIYLFKKRKGVEIFLSLVRHFLDSGTYQTLIIIIIIPYTCLMAQN